MPVVRSTTYAPLLPPAAFRLCENAFRKALLIEFPRPGSWTIAFQTGSPAGDVAARLDGEHVSVYVPTTPNPTSGYFVIVPRTRVHELDMTVDEALKYIISMGVVVPRPSPPQAALGRPGSKHSDPAHAPVADSRN